MNSEHQDGKTEPAFPATGWDFIVGTFGGTDQLHNDRQNRYVSFPCSRRGDEAHFRFPPSAFGLSLLTPAPTAWQKTGKNLGVSSKRWWARKPFWTAAASGARRRFRTRPLPWVGRVKALSPLRSASAVHDPDSNAQLLFIRSFDFENMP
jgi:hypothetical protein